MLEISPSVKFAS